MTVRYVPLLTTLDPSFFWFNNSFKKLYINKPPHGLRNGPVTQGVYSCRQACMELQTTFIENYERMSNIWTHLILRGLCGVKLQRSVYIATLRCESILYSIDLYSDLYSCDLYSDLYSFDLYSDLYSIDLYSDLYSIDLYSDLYSVQYWPIQWPVQLTSSDPSGQLRSKLQRQSNGMHCWVPHRNWLLPHRVRFPDSTPAHRKQIRSVTEMGIYCKSPAFYLLSSFLGPILSNPLPTPLSLSLICLALSLTSFCVISTSAYASGREMVAGPNIRRQQKRVGVFHYYLFSLRLLTAIAVCSRYYLPKPETEFTKVFSTKFLDFWQLAIYSRGFFSTSRFLETKFSKKRRWFNSRASLWISFLKSRISFCYSRRFYHQDLKIKRLGLDFYRDFCLL